MQRRPASEQDFEAVFALHREALREHVERIWGGWDDDWQRQNFQREFSEPGMSGAYSFYMKLGFRETSPSRTGIELVWRAAD